MLVKVGLLVVAAIGMMGGEADGLARPPPAGRRAQSSVFVPTYSQYALEAWFVGNHCFSRA